MNIKVCLLFTVISIPTFLHAANVRDSKPIGHMQMKGAIYKHTYIKNPDESLEVRTEFICVTKTTVPVYDFRNGEGAIDRHEAPACETTVEGAKVSITLDGNAMILKQEVFPKEGPKELKTITVSLTSRSSLTSAEQYQSHRVATADLDTQSFLLPITTDNFVCLPINDGTGDLMCEPIHWTYFSADVEFSEGK